MIKKYLTWDVIFFLAVLALMPILLGDSFFFETVNMVGIYAIAVIGLNLILGVSGLLSVGHAAFFGLGAYCAGYLSKNFAVAPVLSVVIGVLFVALVALLVGIPLLRLTGYSLALGTLGLGVIVYTLINGGGALTGGSNGMTGVPNFSIGAIQFDTFTQYFYLIWVSLFIVHILARNLMNSREGRALTAIHSDESVAAAYGIPVFRYKLKIFVFGCALSALAGGYLAHYMQFISPQVVSLEASIDILIMGFLGGFGSYLGPVFGTFVFQLISEVTTAWHLEKLETLVKGVLLLLILIFFPLGINGGLVKLQSWVKTLWKRKAV